MRTLIMVFAIMAVAGFATAQYGAGIIAIVIVPFLYWADEKMNRNILPRPVCPKSTDKALADYECECFRNSL